MARNTIQRRTSLNALAPGVDEFASPKVDPLETLRAPDALRRGAGIGDPRPIPPATAVSA